MFTELGLLSVDKDGINDFVLSMSPTPELVTSELSTIRNYMKGHIF